MLDGGICLIVLISAIIGAAKGIGNTVLRLIGLAGGLILGVFYSEKATEWLSGTRVRSVIYKNLFKTIRGTGADETASNNLLTAQDAVGPDSDPYTNAVPRIISGAVNDLADKAAAAAAERFTQIIMGVLGFLLIVLAVWFVTLLIRILIKHGRKSSFVLGFTDRLLGFALGVVKGIVLACLAAMAFVPLVTMFAPDSLPAVMEAMDQTEIAHIVYDVNPLLVLIRYFNIV